jgi:hypothetical protein
MRLYNNSWGYITDSSYDSNLGVVNISLNGRTAGDYYLVVWSDYNTTTNWTLTSIINAHNCESITDISQPTCGVGSQNLATGSITQGGFENGKVYKLILNTNNVVTGNIQLDYATAGNLGLKIYNNTWKLVANTTGVSNKKILNLKGMSNGDYYLVVYGIDAGQTGAYTLTGMLNTTTCYTPTIDLGEIECAKIVDFGTYNVLQGVESNGVIFRLYLKDTVNPSQGSGIQITLTDAVGPFDLRLYVANQTTGQLSQVTSNTGYSNSLSISLKGRPAGTYYLVVYGRSYNNVGEFNLKILYNTYTCLTYESLGALDEGESSSLSSSDTNSSASSSN